MARGRLANILIGLLALNFVIIVHESGHFTASKLFGVRVNTFSIGFPPVLASVKLGETTFQLGALPLGGYNALDEKELQELPYPKKMVMVFAGIFFNFLLAFFIFFGLARRTTKKAIPVVAEVIPDSPGSRADIQPGDRYVALNGTPIHENNLTKFLQTIMASPGKTMQFTIQRNDREFELPVTIGKFNPLYGYGVGRLGTPLKTVTIPKPSLWQAITDTGKSFSGLFRKMGPTVAALLRRNGGSGVTGPLGMMSMMGKSLSFGLDTFFYFMALISLNLGLFNLLPIPMLDGGQAARYTIEALVGSELPKGVVNIVYILFMVLMLIIVFRLTVRDVRRLRTSQKKE